MSIRWSRLTTCATTLLLAATSASAQQPLAARLLAVQADKHRDAVVVVCTDNTLLGFNSDRIARVAGDSITLKENTVVATGAAPEQLDAASAQALATIIELAFDHITAMPDLYVYKTGGATLSAGSTKIKLQMTQTAASCAVRELLTQLPSSDYGAATVLAQHDQLGAVTTMRVSERARQKQKEDVEACTVRMLETPAIAEPLPSDVDAAFREALRAQLNKRYKNVSFADTAAGGNVLEIMPLGVVKDERYESPNDQHSNTAQFGFTVRAAGGRVLSYARAAVWLRARPEVNVQELAARLTCE